MNKVLINGNREVQVIRKRTIEIVNGTGELVKVKLKDYKKPEPLTEIQLAEKELRSIFPEKKKDEKEKVRTEYNSHEEYVFALEMQNQIDNFQAKQRSRKRTRRHTSDWSN